MNWRLRIRNKNWWLAIVPAVLVLIQVAAVPFGYKFEFGALNEQLVAIINAAFVVLALIGITNDPTTAGLGDSDRAKYYDEPWDDRKGDERHGAHGAGNQAA